VENAAHTLPAMKITTPTMDIRPSEAVTWPPYRQQQ
jgi:hypothetical protein